MMKFAVSFIALFACNVFAVGPTITGVAGASSYTLASITGTTITGNAAIFGGFGGTDCSNGGSATGVCNSCTITLMSDASAPVCATAAEGLCVCNRARAFDNLTFVISVKRPDTTAGNLRVQVSDGTTTTVLNNSAVTTSDTISATWSQLCTAAGIGASCESVTGAKVINAKIWVDKVADNVIGAGEEATDFTFKVIKPDVAAYSVYGAPTEEGIGGTPGFIPYPGDEKIYLGDDDITTTSNFPNLNYTSKAVRVRVFHSANSILEAHAESADWQDLAVSASGNTLDRNIVDNGLSNDVTYAFRVALVDEGENVVQFFPANGIDANCDATGTLADCTWAATPEKVLGLLSDDINCFVATAAYGSFMEPKLNTFRDFKFRILLQSKWGRKFVDSYYHYGPYAARYIYDKPALRFLARAALWPFYVFSAGALKFGLFPAFFGSLMFFIAVTAFGFYGLRRGLAARAE